MLVHLDFDAQQRTPGYQINMEPSTATFFKTHYAISTPQINLFLLIYHSTLDISKAIFNIILKDAVLLIKSEHRKRCILFAL